MRYLLIAIALLIFQSTFAADSTKVNKVKKDKTESVKTEKTEKAEKVKKGKEGDSVKVVTPPAPPTPLFTDVIPQPLSLVKGEGRFTIDEQTAIICDKGLEKAAGYLTQYIHLTRTKGKKSNTIRLVFDEKIVAYESFYSTDCNGLVDTRTKTKLFALFFLRTNSSANGGERVGTLYDFARLVKVALRYRLHHFGNANGYGTTLSTGRVFTLQASLCFRHCLLGSISERYFAKIMRSNLGILFVH